MNIGLLGGAFDPVHNGHLACAERAADRFGLERVFFIPTAVPPHKQKGSATPQDRWEMVKRAVRGNARFCVSRHEMGSATPSYTIDTVRWFRKKFGAKLYYIIGMDAFAEIHSWKSSGELLRECHFIVASRPGAAIIPSLKRLVREFRADGVALDYLKKPGKDAMGAVLRATGSPFKVYVSPFPELDISSTALRRMAAGGESIKYLVPDKVEQYIIRRGLYHR